MKKYLTILAVFLFAFSIACKEEKKSDVASSQMEEIRAIHDEVMPEMGRMGRLVTQLREKIDTDQGGVKEKEAMEDLQEAHKNMMDWMQGFGNRFDSDEIIDGKELTEEKKQWLNEEEKKINLVRDKMLSSIKKAEMLLKKKESN